MAWPIGRLWRVCMVGIGVCVVLVYGVYGVGVRCYGVCGYGAMALVYGVQALGGYGVRCYGVGCTCVCRSMT